MTNEIVQRPLKPMLNVIKRLQLFPMADCRLSGNQNLCAIGQLRIDLDLIERRQFANSEKISLFTSGRTWPNRAHSRSALH